METFVAGYSSTLLDEFEFDLQLNGMNEMKYFSHFFSFFRPFNQSINRSLAPNPNFVRFRFYVLLLHFFGFRFRFDLPLFLF